MKRYITYEPYTEGVGNVTGIFVGAIPESITGGIESESLDPVYVQLPGMTAALRINIETGELYYDYIKLESTETRLVSTQTELTQVQQALADAYEQLMIAQIESTTTQQALSDLYEQMLQLQEELAALKGGGE
ncbi:hypothetical protein [Paenibacillus gallinarum]|uniref:Uncharacterized protein n=1 Tax=Paenibacillus gallinarum TaxID=2762232 RepID=A0ABR8SWA3_9BACL|nr:hypothetical protein [Paenibacillus gallinarum]MBD7967773.1 hypothetical protein [Paenibacillus gallinarum]